MHSWHNTTSTLRGRKLVVVQNTNNVIKLSWAISHINVESKANILKTSCLHAQGKLSMNQESVKCFIYVVTSISVQYERADTISHDSSVAVSRLGISADESWQKT